jgi:ankyrin repeat protein
MRLANQVLDACRNGNLHKVKYLIDHDVNVNKNSAMRLAAIYGHLKIVKYLVKQGADIHAVNDLALQVAARYGHREVVQYLNNIKERKLTMNLNEQLFNECENGNLDKVKRLVKQGADIHADDLNKVKQLVEQGANIHARDDLALRLAAEYGHLEVVKFLVEQGANIHARDNYAENDYALRRAAGNGQLDVVKYLVEKGANIHADDDYALQVAARYGHREVVQYLNNIKERKKTMAKTPSSNTSTDENWLPIHGELIASTSDHLTFEQHFRRKYMPPSKKILKFRSKDVVSTGESKYWVRKGSPVVEQYNVEFLDNDEVTKNQNDDTVTIPSITLSVDDAKHLINFLSNPNHNMFPLSKKALYTIIANFSETVSQISE